MLLTKPAWSGTRYVPPENSSRFFDINKFYDSLLSYIYKYQNEGTVYVCGDFNSRCGDLDDFIRGIDDVSDRNIIDFNLNRYGKIFIDFLINTNMSILNGRGSCLNDFTSVSVNGKAVVDYCFVNHEILDKFSGFSVIRTSDLINQTGELSVIAPTSIPDHSLLKWKIEIQNVLNVANSCPNASEHAYPEHTIDDSIKFDVTNISSQFLGDYLVLQQVNETISKLESSMRSQSDIDCIYTDWCNIL